MREYTTVERAVLTQLQRGIDPVARPFEDWQLPAAEVVELLLRAQSAGLLRRFGAVFDARRLGYKSVLCALDVPSDELEGKAAVIAAEPGVTHCYERRPLESGCGYPALWFTFAQLYDEFDEDLARLRRSLETPSVGLIELPALRRFKIDVVFDLRTVDRDETFPGAVPAADFAGEQSFSSFSENERAIVRSIDQNIPLCECPFDAVAAQLGIELDALLAILQEWKTSGVLRRIAAVLYHRRAGFKANAMCVWPVTGDCVEIGRKLAAQPEVTHCYQRPRRDEMPFDLYAMIHTASWPQTRALFEDISTRCGLPDGQLFASVREFKKSSMQYFN